MPTQPPQEGEASSSGAPLVPSAPVLDGSVQDAEQARSNITTPSTPGPPASVASARSADTVRPYSNSPPPPSPAQSAAAGLQPTEDKQELERRRIMAQASAPPPINNGEGSGTQPEPPAMVPSAPALPDDGYIHVDGHDAVRRARTRICGAALKTHRSGHMSAQASRVSMDVNFNCG